MSDKEAINKLADGWLSKKLLVFMLVFAVGVGLAWVGKLDATVASFLLSLPVAYGVINVSNKAAILRYTLGEPDELGTAQPDQDL